MESSICKPCQRQPRRAWGGAIPETRVTSQPVLVRGFRGRHKRVIYKSISGVRSIVQTLSDQDLDRLDHIRWCPTQFQAYIEGTDVRVHVVDQAVFATAITSDATDYRYANRQVGDPAHLREIEIPVDLAERCVLLARALDLAFVGIDPKITLDNEVFCFEVNPSPAFSYYEANTGQPIAQA